MKTSYATEKTKHERNKKKGVVFAHMELYVRYHVNTLGASSFHPYNNSVKEVCPFYREGHWGQVAGSVMSQAECPRHYFKYALVLLLSYSTPGIWLLLLSKWKRGRMALEVITEEQMMEWWCGRQKSKMAPEISLVDTPCRIPSPWVITEPVSMMGCHSGDSITLYDTICQKWRGFVD